MQNLDLLPWRLVALGLVFVVQGSVVGGALGLFVGGLDGDGLLALFLFVSEGYGGCVPELALMSTEAGIDPFGLGACTAAGGSGGSRARSWYGWSCKVEREVESLRGGKQVWDGASCEGD